MEPSQIVVTSNHVGMGEDGVTPGVRLIEVQRLLREFDRLVQSCWLQLEMEPVDVDPSKPSIGLRKVAVQFKSTAK